jgi:hypothetical protein
MMRRGATVFFALHGVKIEPRRTRRRKMSVCFFVKPLFLRRAAFACSRVVLRLSLHLPSFPRKRESILILQA